MNRYNTYGVSDSHYNKLLLKIIVKAIITSILKLKNPGWEIQVSIIKLDLRLLKTQYNKLINKFRVVDDFDDEALLIHIQNKIQSRYKKLKSINYIEKGSRCS